MSFYEVINMFILKHIYPSKIILYIEDIFKFFLYTKIWDRLIVFEINYLYYNIFIISVK